MIGGRTEAKYFDLITDPTSRQSAGGCDLTSRLALATIVQQKHLAVRNGSRCRYCAEFPVQPA